MLEDDLTASVSCTFAQETKLKLVVIAITRIMGLSSKLQTQTSTMKLISLLLAILHASEGMNEERQLKKRDAPSEKEKCLNQSIYLNVSLANILSIYNINNVDYFLLN